MPTSIRIHALLAKDEATYGVDSVPATTDAVRITSPEGLWPLLRPRDEWPNRRDDATSGTLVPPKHGVPVGAVVDIDIPWEVKGKGAAYSVAATDIEAGPLLKACGLSVALDTTGGAEKLTYTLADTGHGSCTLYAYAGDLRYIITGCRGNLVWPVNAGQNGLMTFRMTGMLATDPTTVAAPSVTYDSQLPPVAKAAAFTLNPGASWSADLQECEFDLGNNPIVVPDASAVDAINEISLESGRNPQFRCTVRKDLLTDYNPDALYKAVTSHLIDLTLGQNQYNRLKLDINESYLATRAELVTYPGGTAGYRLSFDVKTVSLIVD